MTLVHIVLVKLKPEVLSDGEKVQKFKQECDALWQKPEIRPLAKEMIWGPPEYTSRNRGYDWGLYSVFEDKASYEKYRDHPIHRAFVSEHIMTCTDDLLAYDFEV